MGFIKLKTVLLIAAGIMALGSCKDKDKAEAKPSLAGALAFDAPEFVKPGDLVKMTPRGMYHPDGKNIGYWWKVSPKMKSNDTTRFENGLNSGGKESDGSFSWRFSDSLATYTINCHAFAKDYSGADAYRYVTVVQPGLDGSITGTGIKAEDPKITHAGVDYYYVSHNGLDWMRNNLANPVSGAPYANATVVSSILGRFYSHEEALTACPEGWRLPTDLEWRELAASMNGKEVAGEFSTVTDVTADFIAEVQMNKTDMWEYWPEVGEPRNTGKMAVIPSGYANLGEKDGDKYPTASFYGLNEYSTFWTADMASEGMAYYRYLICDQPDMFIGKGDVKTFGANVRCVRESR